jgi:hypothetical protein
MAINPSAWLAALDKLPDGFQRHAVPADRARREAAGALMARLDPGPADLYPWGLEASHRLWEPWSQARDQVEAAEPAEPGAAVDYILHDPDAGTLTLGLVGALAGGCPRFGRHACNKLTPMGHENQRETCDYWDWPAMAGLTPGLELYPEWQRFDCHRYHALFQAHLCGAALGALVKCRVDWVWHGPAGAEKRLGAYAGLTDTPGAFRFEPWA